MYTKKGSPYSENFVPSDHLTETKEVLFPISETQDIDESATISIPVKEMHNFSSIADLAHDAAISVVTDEQVTPGAEMLLKISAITADRTITFGTGISGNSFVVPTGETRYLFAKYNGTAFIVVSADVAVVDDGSVTAAKLASDAVTTAKILNANVTADKLASDAVTTAKILNANVTADKLASDAVTTAKILNANVTADKLASDAVTTAKILNANVTADKLASDAVTTAKILNANVTADKLASDAVTTDKILDKAVTTAKIDDAAVTGTQLANLAVDTEHIAAKAIETSKIDDLAITAGQIAADAVETAKIKDKNVTLAKLADGVAAGDIIYWSGTAWTIIPKGTDGQVLKMVSGSPAWAADLIE